MLTLLAATCSHRRSQMSRQIQTEIEIDATPEQVWDVLTDFAAYPEWNPFIQRIAGDVMVGAKLDAYLQPPGNRGMRFRPTVLAAAPAQELRWLGHLGFSGIFDGEHIFRIEPLGTDRVRFVQEERGEARPAPPPVHRGQHAAGVRGD